MNLRDLSKQMDYERILEEQKAEVEYLDAADAARAEFKRDIAPAQQEYAACEAKDKARLVEREIALWEFGALRSASRINYAAETRTVREKYNAAEAEALRVFREKMAAIQEKYSFLECYQDFDCWEFRRDR